MVSKFGRAVGVSDDLLTLKGQLSICMGKQSESRSNLVVVRVLFCNAFHGALEKSYLHMSGDAPHPQKATQK
eukprot:5424607-Amphidinium_carterae.1